MKFYNFSTKKVYESDGTFVVSVKETPLRDDVSVKEYEDEEFYSYDEAIEYINDVLAPKILGEEGFDENDYQKEDDGMVVTVTVPNYKQWSFVINGDNLIECMEAKANGGKVNESEKPADGESSDDASENSSEDKADEAANESVATRFAKYRAMFESDDEDESGDEGSSDDEGKGDEGSDSGEGSSEKGGDDEDKDKDKDGDENSDDDEAEMTAIVLTVAHGDGEKLKKEMLDAKDDNDEDYGFDEDNIEVIEGEDDEDDKVKIDASEAFNLKKFLADKKDIDLEDEIGGEIVDDSDEDSDDDSSSDDEGGEGSDEEGKDGEGEDDFDFNDLGDIFGADETE